MGSVTGQRLCGSAHPHFAWTSGFETAVDMPGAVVLCSVDMVEGFLLLNVLSDMLTAFTQVVTSDMTLSVYCKYED
jgi:hypothetical protein